MLFCGVAVAVAVGVVMTLPTEPLLGVRCVDERRMLSVGWSRVQVVSKRPEAELLRR